MFITRLYNLLSKHAEINPCHIEQLVDFLIAEGDLTNVNSKNIDVGTRIFVETSIDAIEKGTFVSGEDSRATNASVITRSMTGDVSITDDPGVGRVGSLVCRWVEE